MRNRISSPLVVLCASLLFAGAVAPASALAQTSAADTARATELFKAGKAAFAKGELTEAASLFSQSFSVRKSSDTAANLGQVKLELQEYRDAAEHFNWALTNLLPSATDAQRRAVEAGLARARAEVGALRLEITPHGADVLVGSHPVGKSPVAGVVFVEPGEVIIAVKRDGFVAVDKSLVAVRGTEQAVHIELPRKEEAVSVEAPVTAGIGAERVADPAPTLTERPEPKSLVPAYVATGVAVAGVVVGAVFTHRASNQESEADDLAGQLRSSYGDSACSGAAPRSDCARLQSEREGVDSSRSVALGAFVVGGAAALFAGYFYWDALSHDDSRSSARERRAPALLGLRPSLELRPRASATAGESFKLGVTGSF